MPRRVLLILAATVVMLAACGGAASQAPGGGGSAEPTDAPASADGGGDSFPAACSVLTADDWEAVLGNPVEDGSPNGTFVCDWGSEPEQSSGSLLLQPGVTPEMCVEANSAGTIEGFAEPGAWEYDTSFDIPGGTLTLCRPPGFVSIIVTGGIGAEDDEPAYRGMAEQIMQLVLGRL